MGLLTLLFIVVPAVEIALLIVDGLLILVAGVMLLTPGFVTDALGLLVLFPLTRPLFRRFVLKRLASHVVQIHDIRPPDPPDL